MGMAPVDRFVAGGGRCGRVEGVHDEVERSGLSGLEGSGWESRVSEAASHLGGPPSPGRHESCLPEHRRGATHTLAGRRSAPSLLGIQAWSNS